MPSPTKEGALPPPSASTIDGKAPNGHIEEDERWARDRVGWAPRFGHPQDDDETNMLEHETWLEDKLQDKFFGGMPKLYCYQIEAEADLQQTGTTTPESLSSLALRRGSLQFLAVVSAGSRS